jgi:hypothetical protein
VSNMSAEAHVKPNARDSAPIMARLRWRFPPGTRVGPYEAVAALGAGGMGEVYRARDTNLNRDVALKILPASVAKDLDRLTRLEREAKTLAAPNGSHTGRTTYRPRHRNGSRRLVVATDQRRVELVRRVERTRGGTLKHGTDLANLLAE